MMDTPGPANYLLTDQEKNEKWNYKSSKASIIGSNKKEFDKDKQYFANLSFLNKSKAVPGPGQYNNEVEPISPKKLRDSLISPKRKKLMRAVQKLEKKNKSVDLTSAKGPKVGEFGIERIVRRKVIEEEDDYKKPTGMTQKGLSIGKGRRKIDVTMFSPSFQTHVKNGLWA